ARILTSGKKLISSRNAVRKRSARGGRTSYQVFKLSSYKAWNARICAQAREFASVSSESGFSRRILKPQMATNPGDCGSPTAPPEGGAPNLSLGVAERSC